MVLPFTREDTAALPSPAATMARWRAWLIARRVIATRTDGGLGVCKQEPPSAGLLSKPDAPETGKRSGCLLPGQAEPDRILEIAWIPSDMLNLVFGLYLYLILTRRFTNRLPPTILKTSKILKTASSSFRCYMISCQGLYMEIDPRGFKKILSTFADKQKLAT
jgi:hypothetical protein